MPSPSDAATPFKFPLSAYPIPSHDYGMRQIEVPRMLVGLHRDTGSWVHLMPVDGLDEDKVLIDLCEGRQPCYKRAAIRIEDFSCFRINDTEKRWAIRST